METVFKGHFKEKVAPDRRLYVQAALTRKGQVRGGLFDRAASLGTVLVLLFSSLNTGGRPTPPLVAQAVLLRGSGGECLEENVMVCSWYRSLVLDQDLISESDHYRFLPTRS